MNIQSVEDYIGYTVASEIMKKAYGDGMEYELIFQTLLDQMKNNKSESTKNSDENIIKTVASGISLDSLPIIKAGNSSNNYANNVLTYNLSQLRGSSNTSSVNTSNVSTNWESASMNEIYSAVDKYSKMYNVDKNLILAVIKAESNFDSNAVSEAGAKGLMQIMDFNLEAYGVSNPYDVDQNIGAGVRLLKNYLDDCYGNVEMALMAYNAGPGTMLNRGVTSADQLYKMPTETQNYVPKVMAYYKEFLNS